MVHMRFFAKRSSVTIMCHCDEDQEECHRHILQKILQGKVLISIFFDTTTP
jgi:uncharacterized protein YeaO (DUF488 family)